MTQKNFVLSLARECKVKGKGDFLYRVEDWRDFSKMGDRYRWTKMISVSACEPNYQDFVKELTNFGIKLYPLDEESVYTQTQDFIMIVSLM